MTSHLIWSNVADPTIVFSVGYWWNSIYTGKEYCFSLHSVHRSWCIKSLGTKGRSVPFHVVLDQFMWVIRLQTALSHGALIFNYGIALQFIRKLCCTNGNRCSTTAAASCTRESHGAHPSTHLQVLLLYKYERVFRIWKGGKAGLHVASGCIKSAFSSDRLSLQLIELNYSTINL